MSDLIKKLSAQVEETERERKQARDVQRKSAAQVSEYLRQKGTMGREELMEMVCSQLRLERYDPAKFPADPAMAELMDRNLAFRHRAVPLRVRSTVLWLAVENPLELPAFMEIEKATGYDVEPVCCAPEQIDELLKGVYVSRPTAQPVPERPQDLYVISPPEQQGINTSSASATGGAKPMEIIERVLTKALTEHASQVHIRQRKMGLDIHFRIDGILHRIRPPKTELFMPALTRLKDMASLDISKKTLAQEGTFTISVRGSEVRVRVTTVPTIDGENMVLHLPGHYLRDIGLDGLGMDRTMQQSVLSAVDKHSGIVLAGGPANSGRTTLLYSLLQEIARPERSIFTLQEATFYNLDFACQVRTTPHSGYAQSLRHILRQEPDVVLLGNLPDPETAKLAFQAALSGCLVLTTLHAGTAAGAVAKLMSMGIPPYDISASLLVSLNSRLVRRLCDGCKEPDAAPASSVLDAADMAGAMAPRGCERCNQTGYRGRLGVFEYLAPNDLIRSMILRERPFTEIQRTAEEEGVMRTFLADARDKVAAGLTSTAETERIL